jgi:hypothetical protein
LAAQAETAIKKDERKTFKEPPFDAQRIACRELMPFMASGARRIDRG